MQDWQHSAMYAAFMVSGTVDLIGFYSPGLLPVGAEHVSTRLSHLDLWQLVLGASGSISGTHVYRDTLVRPVI